MAGNLVICKYGSLFSKRSCKIWWPKNSFSIGPALRPGQFMILMCLRVCVFACLSLPIYFLNPYIGRLGHWGIGKGIYTCLLSGQTGNKSISIGLNCLQVKTEDQRSPVVVYSSSIVKSVQLSPEGQIIPR